MSRGGREWTLRHSGYEAVVTSVAAGVRLLRYDGRDLVLGYDADEVRPRYRGALLVPWPNRVVDGRYTFDGVEHQLALTEPERGHALHGLVTWTRFELVHTDDASVTLRHRLLPQVGYPFDLEVEVAHRLDERGLTSTVATRNAGTTAAPYGVAAHPYLVAGAGRVDDWTLHLPAAEVLEVTPDRLVPVARRPVAGTDLDFREPHPVAGTEADHAFTGLSSDEDGLVRVRLTGADGSGVACEWDPRGLPWVQVHTADLPDPAETRRGLAVEPMTCPPDAFGSGEDLVVLEPGDEHVASWTVQHLPAIP